MVYADYAFYTTEYFGTAISEEAFPRLALRSSSFLDYYTQGKAEKQPDLTALKMACCAVAEQYQAIETAQSLANKSLTASLAADSGEIQSETVGGYSRTIRAGGESAAAALAVQSNAQSTLAKTAQMYLAGTGLLYRGGCCGCTLHML